MITVRSVRDLHNQLNFVCSSLEAMFRLAAAEHEDIEAAAGPALQRFRELLDASDAIAGPDEEEGVK